MLARGPSLSAEEYPAPFVSDPYLPTVYQINRIEYYASFGYY